MQELPPCCLQIRVFTGNTADYARKMVSGRDFLSLAAAFHAGIHLLKTSLASWCSQLQTKLTKSLTVDFISLFHVNFRRELCWILCWNGSTLHHRILWFCKIATSEEVGQWALDNCWYYFFYLLVSFHLSQKVIKTNGRCILCQWYWYPAPFMELALPILNGS